MALEECSGNEFEVGAVGEYPHSIVGTDSIPTVCQAMDSRLLRPTRSLFFLRPAMHVTLAIDCLLFFFSDAVRGLHQRECRKDDALSIVCRAFDSIT